MILFVHLLISVSRPVLSRRTDPERLVVRMWPYPFLTAAARPLCRWRGAVWVREPAMSIEGTAWGVLHQTAYGQQDQRPCSCVTALVLASSLALALVDGLGGFYALRGTLEAGTVVSLGLLLTRRYVPLTALAGARLDVMQALVSLERVFEVLDLVPPVPERPGARGLPDGLDTVVGERGYRLSGGERRRLTIARLLLAPPRVVVLDEATAHLGPTSEAAVQAVPSEALTGRTAPVIAHRLSTVGSADQILVVGGRRVVERGRHVELLAAGGRYAELHRTQLASDDTAETPLETRA